MDIKDYLRIIWKRRWIIAFAVGAAAALAMGISSRQDPVYLAEAKVFIGPKSVSADSDDLSAALEQLTYGREFLASYAEQLRSRRMAEKVIERQGLDLTPVELSSRVDASIIPDTRILSITVTDSDPVRAQELVNAIAQVFVEDGIEDFGGRSGVLASIFEEALTPTRPISPNPVRDGVMGVLIGLVVGLGLSFLAERLDTTIQNRSDVQRVLGNVPVLANIPLAPGPVGRRIWVSTEPSSPTAEAFRILRTNVEALGSSGSQTILVASPYSGDGKTVVALNLAAAMAASGYKTLLMETDLRKPVLAKELTFATERGLSEVLQGFATLEEVILPSGIPNLRVACGGAIPTNPSELLASQGMADVLRGAKRIADVVIFDTPPALPVTDAAIVARHVDSTLIVVRAGQTPAARLREAKERFDRLDSSVAGVVINGLEIEAAGAYYYGATGKKAKVSESAVTALAVELKPATVPRQEVKVAKSKPKARTPQVRVPPRRPSKQPVHPEPDSDPNSPFSIVPAARPADYRREAQLSSDSSAAAEPQVFPGPGADIARAIKAAVSRGRVNAEPPRFEADSWANGADERDVDAQEIEKDELDSGAVGEESENSSVQAEDGGESEDVEPVTGPEAKPDVADSDRAPESEKDLESNLRPASRPQEKETQPDGESDDEFWQLGRKG
ncbi:MAG TPA: polysaccharide biosynthesis tyrosine autokinase [Actinomycetota bacterium]|nr:polysaccharide biosynthesis tyrosine autokinase [Actinomycetota bacterium]